MFSAVWTDHGGVSADFPPPSIDVLFSCSYLGYPGTMKPAYQRNLQLLKKTLTYARIKNGIFMLPRSNARRALTESDMSKPSHLRSDGATTIGSKPPLSCPTPPNPPRVQPPAPPLPLPSPRPHPSPIPSPPPPPEPFRAGQLPPRSPFFLPRSQPWLPCPPS